MNLPEALRKQKEGFLNAAPQEVIATMQKAIDDLSDSGKTKKSSQKGDSASDFTLEDINSEKINLSATLAKGPVILKFFRGDW